MVKFGNLTDTFREGMQAYADGKSGKSNPYKYGEQKWEDWKDGHAFCKAVAMAQVFLKQEIQLTPPINDNRNKS